MLLFIIIFCVLVALGFGLASGWSDFRGLTISNVYSAAILAAFVVAFSAFYFFAPDGAVYFGSWKSHLLAGVIMFGVTFALYVPGWLGAGDSKLCTVFALWLGMLGLPAFLFYMTLMGGLLALAALLIKKYKPFTSPVPGSWIARTQEGVSAVPYGIAIAFGAVMSFVSTGYFDPARLMALAGGS